LKTLAQFIGFAAAVTLLALVATLCAKAWLWMFVFWGLR
jgi:hypothetical protein